MRRTGHRLRAVPPAGRPAPAAGRGIGRRRPRPRHHPRQTALAWLLHRSPTVLLIPGTSSVAHLHENIAAGAVDLPERALRTLAAIGAH
ncbi:aldo/keto reductase [Kitasatospora paranensis]|uniref:aldo/keto reductase n=1 Tax=Kitasatospora paranensis TaxID=258053 RepID=UPI003CD0846E